ncbi:MAG TPA: hypothetical protein VFT91_08585 [Dehalococcoidia bacterium]|nr:hypothetical protein [Dehalococcoidia bacterium]
MAQEFFDLLRRRRLADIDALDRRILHHDTLGQLINLDQELADALPFDPAPRDPRDITSFDFWPNSELSASLGGCESADCRHERFERLARFATMWADSVYISPHFGLLSAIADDEMRARMWLLGSVKSMLAAEPAFRANIVRIGPAGYNVCPSCESEMDPSMPQIRQILTKAKRSMGDAYFGDVRVRFEMQDPRYLLTITGPEDLLGHGGISIYKYKANSKSLAWLPERIRQRAEAGHRLVYDVPNSRVNDSGALAAVIETVAEDVLHQHLACTVRGTKYLTHRPADKLFLDAINSDDSFSSWNRVLTQYLSYEMPILHGIPLEQLIELRTKDYDAFLVYRDTLKRVIKEHVAKRTSITSQEAAEIYDDVVRPEMNKMNQKLETVRTKLSNQFRRDVLVAGGIVALGLCSGVVAPALIGTAIAAVGGASIVRDTAATLMKRRDATDELKSSDLYFLWRISQESRRN